MEEVNNAPINFDDQLNDTLESIDEIVNEAPLFGFSSIDEREIVYGVSTAIGIDPIIDNIIEIGCNVGEFYFYIERLLGNKPIGYYGVESNEKFIDIARFRINESNTEFYNLNFNEILEFINSNGVENVKESMSINVDWGVLINQFSITNTPSDIASTIKTFIKIPNKGLVITNKFDQNQINEIIKELLNCDELKNRFILRSDFIPNWYSFYFYNNR